jgi:hypothetical protein
MIPITTDAEYNAAIRRGHYRVVATNYLTVWLNDDPQDAYELHLDCGDWYWGNPEESKRRWTLTADIDGPNFTWGEETALIVAIQNHPRITHVNLKREIV